MRATPSVILGIIKRGIERSLPAIRWADTPLFARALIEPSKRIGQDPVVVRPAKLLAKPLMLALR